MNFLCQQNVFFFKNSGLFICTIIYVYMQKLVLKGGVNSWRSNFIAHYIKKNVTFFLENLLTELLD